MTAPSIVLKTPANPITPKNSLSEASVDFSDTNRRTNQAPVTACVTFAR